MELLRKLYILVNLLYFININYNIIKIDYYFINKYNKYYV